VAELALVQLRDPARALQPDDRRRAGRRRVLALPLHHVGAVHRAGDDFIQTQLGGGRVDESQFSHGTSAQRELWYSTGYETGDPSRCDTFARGIDLG
jgi:hypothetical protein